MMRAEEYDGVRFVLTSRCVICPGGHLGMMTSEVWFDTVDQRDIEMLFDHLRCQGHEVEGIYVPRF